MFAARIAELQLAVSPAFPARCDVPLTHAVGTLNDAMDPVCAPGMSANACALERYDTPPPLSSLASGCAPSSPGCLVAKWVSRCTNGTEQCTEREARCVDGTRGLAYIKPAPGSKHWVFYVDASGSPCHGDRCWTNYRFLSVLGSPKSAKALSTLFPESPTPRTISGAGVMIGDPMVSPLAQGYNRVQLDRCTELTSDTVQMIGLTDGVSDAVREVYASESPGTAQMLPAETRRSSVPVHHRGLNVWTALFATLTTAAGRDLNGDGTPDLSSFADADVVWIISGSDGANWVVHGGDLLAERVRQFAPNAQVRLGIDSFFRAGIDNEARYLPDAGPAFNIYQSTYSEDRSCGPLDVYDPYRRAPVTATCDDTNYAPNQTLVPKHSIFSRASMDARGVVIDASCRQYHGADDRPCYDTAHVLVHHLATAHLVISDRNDPAVSGAELMYVGDTTLTWRSGTGAFGRRTLDTARDIERHSTTAQREEGALAFGTTLLMLRNANRQGQPPAAVHVFTGDASRMSLQMTRCNGTTPAGPSVSVFDAIRYFDDRTRIPDPFMVEDPDDAAGTFWLTGGSCTGGPQ
ncbi:MAG: hypothetical protein JNK82_40355 [Myxococcaceae bacterium]|nr:hypothetical protein [Myxococcaceae bacterium]